MYPEKKKRKFHVTISYGELESFGNFVTAFVQSNFEPDIGLRGVFQCDDIELYLRIPKLECQYNGHYYSECSVEISVGYPLDTSEYFSGKVDKYTNIIPNQLLRLFH